MPSKSKKQQDFMAAVANNPKFAKKAGVPQSVGKDYEEADNMKKQGYNARLDDSMGAKNGKKKQGMKSRRDESEGMEKSMGKRKFAGDKAMKFQRGGPMPARPMPARPMPAGMANPQAGVTGAPPPPPMQRMETYFPPGSPIAPETMERIKTKRKARRQEGARSGRGGMKKGGSVRGAGCATKGTRAAKMVTMKGS